MNNSKNGKVSDLVVGLASAASQSEKEEIISRIRSLPLNPLGVVINANKLMNVPEGSDSIDLLRTANGILIAAVGAGERGISPEDADTMQYAIAAGEPYIPSGHSRVRRHMGIGTGDIQFKPMPVTLQGVGSTNRVPLFPTSNTTLGPEKLTFKPTTPVDFNARPVAPSDLKDLITAKEAQLVEASGDARQLLDDRIRYAWARAVLTAPKEVIDRFALAEPDFSNLEKFDSSMTTISAPKLKSLWSRLNLFGSGDLEVASEIGYPAMMVGDILDGADDYGQGGIEDILGAAGKSISGLAKGVVDVGSKAWNRLGPGEKTLATLAVGATGGYFVDKLIDKIRGAQGDENATDVLESVKDVNGTVPIADLPADISLRFRELGARFMDRSKHVSWLHKLKNTSTPGVGDIMQSMAMPLAYVTDEGDIMMDPTGELYTGGFFSKALSGLKNVAKKSIGGLAKLAAPVAGLISPTAGRILKAGGNLLDANVAKNRSNSAKEEVNEQNAKLKDALNKVNALGASPEIMSALANVDPNVVKQALSTKGVSSDFLESQGSSTNPIGNAMTQAVSDYQRDASSGTASTPKLDQVVNEWDTLADSLPFVGDAVMLEGNPLAVASLRVAGQAIVGWFSGNILGKLGQWFSRLFTKPNPAAVAAAGATSMTVNVVNKVGKSGLLKLRNILAGLVAAGTAGYILEKHYETKAQKQELIDKLGQGGFDEFVAFEAKVKSGGVDSLSDEEAFRYSQLIATISGVDANAGGLEAEIVADPNPESGSSVLDMLKKYGPMLALILGILGGPKLVKWLWAKAKTMFSPTGEVALGDPDPEYQQFLQGGLKLNLKNIGSYLNKAKTFANNAKSVAEMIKDPKKAAAALMTSQQVSAALDANPRMDERPTIVNGIPDGTVREIAPLVKGLPPQEVKNVVPNVVALNPNVTPAEWQALDQGKILDINPEESIMLVTSVTQPQIKKWIKVYKS